MSRLLIGVLLPSVAAAQRPSPASQLGNVLHVRESEYGRTLWDGTWTRRGNSDVYDAVWRRVPDGAEVRDTLRNVRIRGNQVLIHRDGLNADYVGYLSADGKRIERGTAPWYKSYSSWVADLDGSSSPVRAGSSASPAVPLGNVLRVRESEYGKTLWNGTWTRRGNSDVYDAVWRRVPDGVEVRDVLRNVRIEGDRVLIHRDGPNGDYVGYLSADGRRIERGTASWYMSYSSWVADLEGGSSAVTPQPTGAPGTTLIDLRATFPRIEPYSTALSKAVVRDFVFPGPGRFRVTFTLSPWYRNGSEMIQWRSSVPIDGRDFGAWVPFVPGATSVSSVSTPAMPVDAASLVLINEYTVRSAQPGMQVAIFPATMRFGDGSVLQLPGSASVVIEWLSGAGPSPAAQQATRPRR